jgi:hypothetical protein
MSETSSTGLPRARARRRAALALVLAVAFVLGVPIAWASHLFTDVPDSNPFHGDISAIQYAGITSGKTCTPPGTPPTYCPQESITREAMAAFVHRGFGRAAYGGTALFALPNNGTPVEIATITLNIGGVAGGFQFVKVDAAVGTSMTSTTGCPCESGYYIQAVELGKTTFLHQHTNADVAVSFGGGNWGEEIGAVSAVFAVPTASTQTFRVWALRPAGSTGSVSAYADLTAIVAPFGASGGGTLSSAGTAGASGSPQGVPSGPPRGR